MNALRQELRQYLLGFEERDGKVRGRFLVPAEFTGFQGHFDGKPVLPGVCKIQAVAVLWQAWRGRSLEIKEITMAKFLAPVEPGRELVVEFGASMPVPADIGLKAIIHREGTKVAEIHLRGTEKGLEEEGAP